MLVSTSDFMNVSFRKAVNPEPWMWASIWKRTKSRRIPSRHARALLAGAVSWAGSRGLVPKAVALDLCSIRTRWVVGMTEMPSATRLLLDWSDGDERARDDTAPRWLLRDRDAIYGDVCRRRVVGMGITEVITSPSSPWQNPYAERLIGSIRRECLDHVIVLGERHLRRLLTAYLTYYHGARIIWPCRRTRRRHDAFRRLQKDPSSRSLKLADYIIATNDVQPDGHR